MHFNIVMNRYQSLKQCLISYLTVFVSSVAFWNVELREMQNIA